MEIKIFINKCDEIIDETSKITVFDIEDNMDILKKYLDDNIVKICEGKLSRTELFIVKEKVKRLFHNKTDDWQRGAVAEFFVHLYMNLSGYKQEFLFPNLEERSIKKGFDGFYTNEFKWIMESKAGSVSTKLISHRKKINEAINDLEKKISGQSVNNPWMNAYNHASHADVSTNKKIIKFIKKLSDDYYLGNYPMMEELNILPCSTIFLETSQKIEEEKKIIADIKQVLTVKKYSRVHAICITQKSIDNFKEYIELT